MKLFFLNQEGVRNLLIRSGIACFLFLLLMGTLDATLPYLIDEQDIKDKIETGLQESLGTNVKIQTLSLHPTLFHGLEVSLDHSRLTVKSSLKKPSQPFATARSIHLYLRYLSLLDAAIYGNPAQISRVSADDLWLNLTPENPLLHPLALKPTHKAEIVLNNTDLELKNFNLLFPTMRFDPPSEKNLSLLPQQLKGKYLTLNHIESNLPYDLSGEVTWNREPEKRPIGTLQFQLEKLWCLSPSNLPSLINRTTPASSSLPTKDFIPLIHSYLRQPLMGQGKIDVLNLSLANLTTDTKDFALPENIEKIHVGFSQQKQGHWLGVFDEASPKPGEKVDNVFQLMVKAPHPPWPQLQSNPFTASAQNNPPSSFLLEGQLKIPESMDPPMASVPEDYTPQTLPKYHPLLLNTTSRGTDSLDSSLNLQDISLQLKALEADLKIQGNTQLNTQFKNSKVHLTYGLDAPNLKALSPFKLAANRYLKILGRWSGKLSLNGTLQGTLEAPRASGQAELKDVALISQNPLNTKGKLSGLSAKLKFNEDSFTMDPFYLTLENHPLSGTLQVFHDPKKIHQKPFLTHWKGSLNIPHLPLESVTNFIQDPDIKLVLAQIPCPLDLSAFRGTGTLQGKAAFHSTFNKPSKEVSPTSSKIETHGWQTDLWGDLTFQNISILLSQKEINPRSQPFSFLSNLNGKIHFTPQKILIQAPLRFDALGEHSLGGSYSITGWYTPKSDKSSMTFQGHQIRLERLQKEIFNLESILKTSPSKGLQQLSAAFVPLHDLQLKGTGTIDLMLSGSPNALQPVGLIRFQETGFLYKSSSSNFKGQLQGNHLLADIQITPERIFLKKASGTIEDALVEATGWWAHQSAQYHGALDVNNINLAQFFQKLRQISPALAHNVEYIRDISGTSHLSLILDSHDKTLMPQTKGTVRVDHLKIHALKLPYLLEIPTLAFALDSHQSLNLPPTSGKLGPWKFTAQGNIPLQKILTGYTFKLATESLPLSLLHTENSTLQTLTNHSLPEIWETEGKVKLSLAVSAQKQTLWMAFQNAALSFEGGDFPLSKVNGAITLEGKTLDRGRLSIPDLKAHYGNSDVHVVSHPDPKKPDATQILLEGKLSPLLLTHYLVPRDSGYTIDTGIPYTLDFSGHPIELLSVVDAGLSHPDLPPKIPSGNPNEILATISYWLGIPTNSKDPNDWLNATGTLQMKGTDVALLDNQLEIPQVGILKLAGEIQDIFDPIDHNYNLQLLSDPPLDLGRSQKEGKIPGDPILRDASGTVSVDLFVKRNTDGTGTSKGFAQINNLIIPALQLNPLTLDCKTENASAQCQINALHLPGVDLQLRALTDNILEIPINFKQVEIKGDSLNLAQLGHYFEKTFLPQIQNTVLIALYRPPKAWEPLFPFEFRDAKVSLNELIYQNILLDHFASGLSVFASGFLELSHLKVDIAGGALEGNLSMNPRLNNYISLEIHPQQVKANALARALLQLPNAIFGDLSGDIRFTTQGLNQDELFKNTNGLLHVNLENGRLPAITKVESLLTAANILRGGLIGLNLNNIINSLRPYDTNNFTKMTGDFEMTSGVVYTENLSSKGQNLDLEIKGNIKLVDGTADLVVKGAMSQDVAGILGTLGKLSVTKIFQFIPGLGYIPGFKRRGGILSLIPGIGYVPGFGGPAKDVNHFTVKIKGPLEQNSSVKDLDWN